MAQCASRHIVCLFFDGKLYSFGRNMEGQLGHGHTESIEVPKEITSVETLRWFLVVFILLFV